MRSLKFGDAEAQFGERLKELKSETLEAAFPTRITAEAADIAESSPRGAIIEAWNDVEKKLRETGVKAGISVPPKNSLALIDMLRADNVITDVTVQSLKGLRSLRNLAAHSTDQRPSIQQAREFITMAEAIINVLDIEATKSR